MREQIEAVLAAIRPALLRDGGDVQLVDVTDDGVVTLRACRSCSHCPVSRMTLRAAAAASAAPPRAASGSRHTLLLPPRARGTPPPSQPSSPWPPTASASLHASSYSLNRARHTSMMPGGVFAVFFWNTSAITIA